MKTILQSLIIISALLISHAKSTACVDYHPDSVNVTILADTANCNMIIELSNLNMFGGNPNDFCSCGVYNSIPDDATIEWVTFVDAETQEPIEGFDLWSFSGSAGDSWSNADPTNIDWSGFVSGVNSAGILAGQDVNLWIILDIDETNPQWSWICDGELGSLTEFFGSWAFGTDEWDNENGVLANSHQSITYLWDQYENFSVEIITTDEYEGIVNMLEDFYNGILEQEASFTLFPNPTADVLNIKTNGRIGEAHLRDLLGKEVDIKWSSDDQIDLTELPESIYILEIEINNSRSVRKIRVNR